MDPFTAGCRRRTLLPLEEFEGSRLLPRQAGFFGARGSREAVELGLSNTATGWDTVLSRKWRSGEDHTLYREVPSPTLLLGSWDACGPPGQRVEVSPLEKLAPK